MPKRPTTGQTYLFAGPGKVELIGTLPRPDAPKDYAPPTIYPDNLYQTKQLSLDLETTGLDPRRGSVIVGVALAADGWEQ